MSEKEFMNLEIGKTFMIGYRKFVVVEADKNDTCIDCHFDGNNTYCGCGDLQEDGFLPECFGVNRKDGKHVIFAEVKNENLE